MAQLACALLFLAVVVLAVSNAEPWHNILNNATVSDQEWAAYKARFRKVYINSVVDLMHRQIYTQRKIKIIEHNKRFAAGLVTFRRGINKFTDMTQEELNCILRGICGPPVIMGGGPPILVVNPLRS